MLVTRVPFFLVRRTAVLTSLIVPTSLSIFHQRLHNIQEAHQIASQMKPSILGGLWTQVLYIQKTDCTSAHFVTTSPLKNLKSADTCVNTRANGRISVHIVHIVQLKTII